MTGFARAYLGPKRVYGMKAVDAIKEGFLVLRACGVCTGRRACGCFLHSHVLNLFPLKW